MAVQLNIPFASDSERQKVSVSSTDTDTKIKILQRFCEKSLFTPFVEKYTPGRRKKEYFRVAWRDGNKMKHIHIPGGNVNSQLAQYRAKTIQELCDRSAELDEIIALINTYRGKK